MAKKVKGSAKKASVIKPKGNKYIYFFGNGGSGAQAAHLAAEYCDLAGYAEDKKSRLVSGTFAWFMGMFGGEMNEPGN